MQRRGSEQQYLEATGSPSEEGIRSRGGAPRANILCGFPWQLEMDRLPPQAPDVFYRPQPGREGDDSQRHA